MRVFGELVAGMDRALAVDPAGLDDRDLDRAVLELARQRARLDALEAKVVGVWDNRSRWEALGSKSAPAYLAHQRRLPVTACRRAPRVARKLRLLPALLVALEAGAVEAAHVDRILALDSPRTHEALIADHVRLTRWAVELPWSRFCRELLDWLEEHDPDGPDPGRASKRRFHCSKTLQDAFALDGWLDPIGGTIFAAELARLDRQLFLQDQADARHRLGREPLAHELGRTLEQRRADALVLMAERSATRPEDGRRAQPLFTVLVGEESFRRICELTNGIQLRPRQLVAYLDNLGDVLFQRVVFDGPTHVLGVSSQRTFRGLHRTAIQARDRTCQVPGCHEPIDRCQVDHRIPASVGGPTSLDNGRLYCGHHNRARNHPDRADRAPPDPRG